MLKQESVTKSYEMYASVPFLYNLLHGMKRYRGLCIDNLRLKEGGKVLEIGCGTGLNFGIVLKRIGDKGGILGIDISQKMIMRAKRLIIKNGWKNVELILDDILDFNLREGHYDAALSFLSLSCVPEHMKAVEKIMGSLKDGGRLVIFDGKMFNSRLMNVFLPLLRWNKSWDKDKDIISDIKRMYGSNIIIQEEFGFGSNFLMVLEKR